jgi:F420-dependent oxidoreductase-like protein
MDELKKFWRYGEAVGFDWISVYDHFYAGPIGQSFRRDQPVFESVSTMAALAATTSQVRVGCVVFCVVYRNPALLAKAVATIDHISGGRAELGIGAGWIEDEFRDFGYGSPAVGQRLDQLEEGVQIIRSLFEHDSTTFHGKCYALSNAVCAPKPLQKRLRIWVGGMGEKRTLRIAARYADGWNAYNIAPDVFRHKNKVLDMWCEKERRDPASIPRTINLGFSLGADETSADSKRKHIMTRMNEIAQQGELLGTSQEVIDRIGRYVDAGVQQINIGVSPPLDWEALNAFVERVLPVHQAR